MSPKKQPAKDSGKRKKDTITIAMKKEIIEKYEHGVRVSVLASEYGRASSTISTILKKKDEFKKLDVAKGVTMVSRNRPKIIDDVEKLLLVWMNERELNGDSVSKAIVCIKAKMLYVDLVRKTPGMSSEDEELFKASRGWLEKFRKRIGIHRVMRPGEAASSDIASEGAESRGGTRALIRRGGDEMRTTTGAAQLPPKCQEVVKPEGRTHKDLVGNGPEANCGNMVRASRQQTLMDRFVLRNPSVVSTKCTSSGHSRVMRQQFFPAKGADVSQESESYIDDDLFEVKDEPLELDDGADRSVRDGVESSTEDPTRRDDGGQYKMKDQDLHHIHNNFVGLSCKDSNYFQMKQCQVLVDKLTIRAFEKQEEIRKATAKTLSSDVKSPIRTYRKQEEIRKAAAEKTLPSDVKTHGGGCLKEMENALYLWIKDQRKQNITVNGTVIRKKATKIQAAIDKKNGASGTSFYPSSGWLSNFRKHHGLHNVIQGESETTDSAADHSRASSHLPGSSSPTTDHTGSSSHPTTNYTGAFSHPTTNHTGSSSQPAANHSESLFHLTMDHSGISSRPGADHSAAPPYSAIDKNAALLYPAEFAAIIREEGYCPEQVFNADETGLFWKSLPKKTFLMEEETATLGFKASKDRMSLLFCSNAAGDFKLPPVLVYRSHRPLVLKNVTNLPVVWRANSKAWVTSTIFADWYQYNFIPAVDKYLRSKNLPSKAILFVDSAPSHPQTLKGTADSDGYRLEFFPPNTSSLLQPLDQGVIAQIKRLYTKQVLWEMFLYTEGKGKSRERVVEFWKKFNIRNAISIITDIWEKIPSSCFIEAWENLWPEIMSDFLGFPDRQLEVRSIVEIANSIPGEGFGDLVAEDIVEHLESHRNIPTPEDTLELIAEEAEEGQDDDSEANSITRIPLSVMRQFVGHMISGVEIADSDPNFKRATEAIRLIRKVCDVYVRPISAYSHKNIFTDDVNAD